MSVANGVDKSREDLRAISVLRSSDLFGAWPDNVLQTLAVDCRLMHFAPDEQIVGQGEVLNGLYVVASGEIMIGTYDHEGRRYVRRHAGKNHVYGFLSVFDGKECPQFYAATRPSEIMFIPKRAFLAALESYPDLWHRVMAYWTRLHRTLLHGLHEIAFDTLRIRLARVLLSYATQYGTRKLADREIRLNITQDQIASFLGASRQSVSREIKKLEKDGYIEVFYGGVVLTNPRDLANLAEAYPNPQPDFHPDRAGHDSKRVRPI